jgi:Rieske 2Fe-2S family protein
LGVLLPIDLDAAALHQLVVRQREGWSLEQPFYLDPAIFDLEREHWFSKQWMVAGHVCELPTKGSFILRKIFGEEIIIVRSTDEDILAFFNVCTHRGSRICTGDGRSPLFVCPYHAWSFKLTGELQSRRDLPNGVNPDELGLHHVPVQQLEGLILVGLKSAGLPPLDDAKAAMTAAMVHHGFPGARMLARKHYPTRANWKLVLENFFECYHCKPSHPEYFRVNTHVNVTAVRTDKAQARWEVEMAAWKKGPGKLDISQEKRAEWRDDLFAYGVYRQPIGQGRKTLSETGEPVAPLMGRFSEYDCGETAFHFGRFSFASATNDYIALFQIFPQEVDLTDVTITWFVNPEGECDPDSVTWMWDVTTRQDKQIVELNAEGVESSAYRPGPYTPLEQQTAKFVRAYLASMESISGTIARQASSQAVAG